jgi:hypothetical protein
LLQHDTLELADRPLSRALTQDHGGGEGALDDGLEVSAIPRTPPRVARFARLEARGDGRAGVANRPARSLCLDGGHQRLNAHDVHDAGERRESIAPNSATQTWPTENRLRGWACKIRTQKCRRKLSF